MSENLKPLAEHLAALVAGIIQFTNAQRVIFSSFDYPEQVMQKLADARITFKVILGKYNAKLETSYIIDAPHLGWLFASGLVDGQESILVSSSENPDDPTQSARAFLVYSKLDEHGKFVVDDLGTFEEIPYDKVAAIDAWSLDPASGLYFGTVQKAS